MTQIENEITEPTLKLCWNVHAIRRAAEVLRAAHLDLMAEDVEAQIPTPIEEPEGFGSIVRAPWSGKDLLWIKAANNSWWSETGVATAWSELRNPEVLRVGLGNTDEDKLAAAFRDGLHEGLRQNQGARFCTRSQNCRMAEGHEGGCER